MNPTPEFFLQFAFGLAFLAFGWTLFRFGVRAVGFMAGYTFGFSVYELIVELVMTLYPEGLKYFPQHPLAPVFAGAVTGVLGVFFAKKIYQVGIFTGVLAGSLYLLYSTDQGLLLKQGLAAIGVLEPLDSTLGNAWPAVLAVLTALLFLWLQKQMITLLTACIGAFILAETLNIPIIFLPLCFVGYLLQQTARKKKPAARAPSGDEV